MTLWRVLRAARMYGPAITAGERWVALETAAADSGYFMRQAADAAALCRFADAVPLARTLVAKYPGRGAFLLTLARVEEQAGLATKAVETRRKAAAVSP